MSGIKIGSIAGILLLVFFPADSLASIPNEKMCLENVCLTLYRHSNYVISDQFVYSRSSGDMMFFVRFSSGQHQLVVYFDKEQKRSCSSARSGRFHTVGRRSSLLSCLETEKNRSRNYYVKIVSESGLQSILPKINPKLSIECRSDRAAASCQQAPAIALDAYVLREKSQ